MWLIEKSLVPIHNVNNYNHNLLKKLKWRSRIYVMLCGSFQIYIDSVAKRMPTNKKVMHSYNLTNFDE